VYFHGSVSSGVVVVVVVVAKCMLAKVIDICSRARMLLLECATPNRTHHGAGKESCETGQMHADS
jgi:hypothetical protein